MHSLLENYLSEVADHLSVLPKKRREEELQEMRQHLSNAVTVSQELGQSEKNAVANAVQQFGTAEELGGNLVWAWRREVTQDRRSFLGAAVTTTLMIYLGFEARGHNLLTSFFSQTSFKYLGEHSDNVMDSTEAMIIMIFGLAGMVAGGLFPKRAVRGAYLGMAFYHLSSVAVCGLADGGVWRFLTLAFGWSLAGIIGAWAGSRWRLAWGKRRRLARV